MGNVFNPESTGESLRALAEFMITSRRSVVGEGVFNMEKANGIELKYNAESSNPTSATPEKVVFSKKAPELVETPKPSVKSSQTGRKPVAKVQGASLNVSTARANLNAIFSSIDEDQK